MKQEILERLMEITPEEQAILDGRREISRELYSGIGKFEVDNTRLMERGRCITVRPHTRFVDFPEHTHNYIEIMYVCQGTITHIVEGKRLSMQAGDLLFLNQRVRHGIQKAGREDLGINFIVLPEFFDIPLSMLRQQNVLADFLVNTLRTGQASPEYLLFSPQDGRAIGNLMENIVLSLLEGREDEDNINQVTMGLIFLHLLNHVDTIDRKSSQTYQELIVNSALQYIENHFRDASLQELATDFHQSVSQLSKLIKKTTGFTFKQLLQQKRFRRAVELLADTALPVADIFSAVGYENSSYFYTRFHEKYGMSPGEYRKRCREGKH